MTSFDKNQTESLAENGLWSVLDDKRRAVSRIAYVEFTAGRVHENPPVEKARLVYDYVNNRVYLTVHYDTPNDRMPLQKLLAEHFQLAVHRQTKERSGYALVTAKSGPELTETKGGSPHGYILKNGIDLQNESMDTLAGILRQPAHAPVVNETGVKGNYDIKLNFAPNNAPNSNLPTLFTTLREKLGCN